MTVSAETTPGLRHELTGQPDPDATAPGTVRRGPWRALDPRTWPWWVQTLVVYGLARAFSALVFLRVAHDQLADGWTGDHPSYAAYTGRMFDATWYLNIATDGYPRDLPVGQDGTVQQNAWAFYPLFPAIMRYGMRFTGLEWNVLGPTLSLLFGAGAVLVIHRLVTRGGAAAVARVPWLPLATVTMVSVFPSSPVLQTAYTEALALLLISGCLYLLAVRRYLWAIPVVVLLGFTRAVALPIAAVVVWHGLWRVWRRRFRGEPLPGRDLAGMGALLVVSGIAGVAWQQIAAHVTGRSDAYFATQAAWRSGPVEYFKPWLTNARILFGDRGPLVLTLVLVAVAVMVLCPLAFRLGPELQGWAIAYVGYLVLVTDPWTSTWRFLLLAFPLLAVLVGWVRHRVLAGAWITVLVAASLFAQVWWVWELWRFVPPADWAP